MEEKKAKEMKMQPSGSKKEQKEQNEQRLSYEQLNEACNQLFQQNQRLMAQVKELNAVNMFKRLDYLFKAIELASIIKDGDFINSCIGEIKEALTIPEEKEEENERK